MGKGIDLRGGKMIGWRPSDTRSIPVDRDAGSFRVEHSDQLELLNGAPPILIRTMNTKGLATLPTLASLRVERD